MVSLYMGEKRNSRLIPRLKRCRFAKGFACMCFQSPSGLVNEAYLRLIGDQKFDHRGHFFAAAAEAMRRILVEAARRRGRLKRGGNRARVELDDVAAEMPDADSNLVDLDEALTRLEAIHAEAAAVAKLRHFVGLTIEQAAEAQGISVRSANRNWAFAKAWLFKELGGISKSAGE